MSEPLTDPGPSTPDDADWTWVLTHPCPDCGFDAAATEPADVPAILRDAGQRYAFALGRDGVRTRPAEGVWSPLEYACHVRDVCDVMRGRLDQILAGGGEVVRFANWDQDETAVERQYWRSDPDVVAREVTAAFEAAATAYALPSGTQWEWPALRSNGSEFTARTLSLYFVHDIHHHLWDVTA
ncbi:DinB family protein [Terrabacter sp. Root181]|uniref:DinB family protein n=1 Tax=Terrabacter sp. Root181 TaxID=1736484 RepID=UPI0006F5EA4C|nr:DinB family protein [Terrabacter sp. Root181]KRB46387.1 methyltransferase type 12 [Terrabacter sp. Root181]